MNRNVFLSLVPLVPSFYVLVQILQKNNFKSNVKYELITYVGMSFIGYLISNSLIPIIKSYTLRKGIAGKDLGKRGTDLADRLIPEALGIVPGSIFLICLILSLVYFTASNPSKLLDCTSALLSICFMLFLGFTDDVLDWPWRYKLLLPTVASLPLLCCYKGSTSILVPRQLRFLLMKEDKITWFGELLDILVTVDENAGGEIVNLGLLYYVYMGCLAVFCSNAINIYAGINGLEAGQSYVIGCFILLHNLLEIKNSNCENHLFSAMIITSFVGVSMALLKHNWYPASVFVGDTYCYFAGMTFAVVGILGHFSKTLLLLFLPQIFNFIWSIPQLFHYVPCPRHRLPNFNGTTMTPSFVSCKPHQYQWFKTTPNATQLHNMTLINICLNVLGPMKEEHLCITLLALQIVTCSIGLWIRYNVA